MQSNIHQNVHLNNLLTKYQMQDVQGILIKLMNYELIAETMKLFGNSAYGKCITNKEKNLSTTYGNEDNISKKINSPHFKDLELLYGQKYEVISTNNSTIFTT